jgi:hypothetical protein
MVEQAGLNWCSFWGINQEEERQDSKSIFL